MKDKKKASALSRRESTPYIEAGRYFEEGIELLYDKSPKKAREVFQTIIDNYPEEKEIADRARTYIKICENTRSRRELVLQTAEEYFTRGTFRFNEGDYDGAIADYQEAMHLDKQADYLPYSIAAIHAVKGDTAQAAASLEKAIKLNPDNRKRALCDDDFAGMIEEPIFAELLQVDAE